MYLMTKRTLLYLVLGVFAPAAVAASVNVIDFEASGYEPGSRPPSPPWFEDWDKEWEETDFTVEADVGFGGSQGLVVRNDRGVFYEFPQPLVPDMGAQTVSVLFRPDAPDAGWFFADLGGVQLGYGSKAGGTGRFVGCIFRIVNQNAGIYGPGSMYGTRITGFSPGQWYEIKYNIAADWESISITVGPVGGIMVSESFEWNGREITKLWTVRSNTGLAVYDNLSIPASPGEGDPFAAWIDGFDLPGELASPEATPAGDGVPNLIKYALGIDPRSAGFHALPAAETGGGNGEPSRATLTAVVRTGDPDLEVAAEASVDLENWNLSVAELENSSQEDVPDGFKRRSWMAGSPDGIGEPVFLRLKVER